MDKQGMHTGVGVEEKNTTLAYIVKQTCVQPCVPVSHTHTHTHYHDDPQQLQYQSLCITNTTQSPHPQPSATPAGMVALMTFSCALIALPRR